MIAAVDVHYRDDATAMTVAVVFSGFTDPAAYRTYTMAISAVESYVPGQFYRRELPCILAILRTIEEEIDIVIVDGYVNLGKKPGLGQHLYNTFDGKKKVIGVAKKYFKGSDALEVFRGSSRRPLYITAAGIDPSAAAGFINQMQGQYRLPLLLRQADSLSRISRDTEI
jgi:deoxyribonuclease V